MNGIVFQGATPERFRVALRSAFDLTRQQKPDHRLVFLKSWNEWAEGNHLEPDLRDGHGFLKVIAEELQKESRSVRRQGWLKMKCSVIIPLYNKRATVRRALDSVLAQTVAGPRSNRCR